MPPPLAAEVCAIDDETLARNLLEFYDYDLEVAIHNFVSTREEAGSSGVSNDDSHQDATASTSSSASPSP
ncbi:unnamed protein product [Soboliphyme baturini]|uniref:LisH domain-containing protein n=1 Tax=Soboliphyme baturini TaxID=241478 RepID=A0A183J508_9BILA|nr:unnamed protein product [Soboliphyme baturini]